MAGAGLACLSEAADLNPTSTLRQAQCKCPLYMLKATLLSVLFMLAHSQRMGRQCSEFLPGWAAEELWESKSTHPVGVTASVTFKRGEALRALVVPPLLGEAGIAHVVLAYAVTALPQKARMH